MVSNSILYGISLNNMVIIILTILIILIKVLITRKEILRDDRTLPAPAITVCPYFVDNVNPEVIDDRCK